MSRLTPETDGVNQRIGPAPSGYSQSLPWNAAQLPLFPSQLLPRPEHAAVTPKAEPFSGTGFQGASFSNTAEFDHGASTGFDWEHMNREPSGSSIIDNSSVYDDSGRSYHGYKQGKYFLPNDAAEQDRLDLQHAGYTLLLDGKLGLAPVKNPEFVLDVATGTGIWAMQYAEQHPETQVIGTDLSDIQPKWKLPNCSFIQEDSEEEWLFGSTENPIWFDYVHLRLVFTCFDNPRQVMRHAFQNLKPGGWIEYCDSSARIESIDNNLEGTALRRYGELVTAGLAKNGRDVQIAEHYAEWLKEEGFVDVVDQKFICPGSPWPENERLKQCGRFMLTNAHQGFRGVGWKLFKSLGLSTEEIEQLIIDVKKCSASHLYRWFIPVHVVYARKPFDWEVAESSGEAEIPVKTEDKTKSTP